MKHRAVPRFVIRDVLVALGADGNTIPSGTGWRRMKCFLHADNTPSASVNHELHAYACFSCGVKGDAVKVVQQVEQCDFKTALAFCEEAAGTPSESVPRTGWGGTRLSL